MNYGQYETVHDETVANVTAGVNIPLERANKIVAQIFSMYPDDCDRSDAETLAHELTDFIHDFLAQPEISGDADEWHNLVVDIARKNYYDLCCDLLEEGLQRFPGNTDLLGDYLQYGTSCGRIEKCKQCYKLLAKLPKVKYTWRSFHFSVSWLTYLWEGCESERKMDELYDQMLALAADYRKYFPYKEDSYVCEADIYRLKKQTDQMEKVLLKAVEAQFPSPKCSLRLADIYFEQGDYSKSLDMVQKSLKDANRVQQAVSEEYLYYLSGLARISIRNNSKLNKNTDGVEEIYRDFEDCLRVGSRRDFRNNIRDKGTILKRQTGVDIPDDCRKLYELLDGSDLL